MTKPAPGEALVFLLLLAASLWLFWRRLGRILKTVRSSKAEPDFRLAPLSRRLPRFVWEVLLQGKVIGERPLAGLAHAFVFWGFCVFALITLDHLGHGLGLDLVSPTGAFGRVYFFFAALFAAAVSVSIVGLAVRRFLARPRWLGKVSPESGLIAFLIFALMATYLADYLLRGHGLTGRLLWWGHTAALLFFLPLIPHTKHLHLALSPFTVFLKRDGFSRIPPLAGEEDFGLDTGKDVSWVDALQAYSCVECGRCTEHCPAFHTGKLLNPKEIILGLRGYLNQHGAAAEAPLLGQHIAREAVFQCTTCGACEFQCPVGIQHLPVMVGLRRGAVNTGKWEDEHGTRLFRNLERYGNVLAMAASERQRFIERAALPYFDGGQEYCLWLGCMGAYDPQGREIVVALAKVLKHLGVSFGVLRREKCSGDAARRLGNDLAFAELARFNLEEIRTAGVRKMLSICPHCVRTIAEDWREFGAAPRIEHHSEFLARRRAGLNGAGGGRIVFHDPCYLGRYRGIYDPPRQLASLGGTVVDPPRARRRSFCCGAGGGLVFLGEEKGKRISAERAGELLAARANVIAAACPFCHTMFRDALPALSAAPPPVLDIAQIAAARLS